MNILYTMTAFPTGGAEKLVLDMINNLAFTKGDSINLCIINKKYDESLLKQINPKVNVFLLNRSVSGDKLKYLIKYNKFVENNKIDIIHCQCIDSVKFSVIAKLLNRSIKIFHTVHDTKLYTKYTVHEVLVDKLFTKKIIAISEIVKDEVLSMGVKPSKVVKIYNAINISKFTMSKQRNINSSSDSIIIGNVARIVPEKKGQDILIKAISKLKSNYPNIKCFFAGAPPEGKDQYLKDLVNLAKLNNVEENIVFIGNVQNIPEFLAKLDIFVLPSRYEGFGISLIEAMATGVPCIASNIDGPKEIIKNDQYGILFQNNNCKDLSEKIEIIIKNRNKIDKDKVINYVSENFSMDKMMREIYTIYLS